ncbi:UNVERIFIED_CONTAM: hypothetical protein PYX00_005241 [Menopon gallinae]|uniref:CHCH domain-containing protein n=1 Tax=Menopon gallinae TaxID=328185 RepID=A0AAW2HRA9_9NEOP
MNRFKPPSKMCMVYPKPLGRSRQDESRVTFKISKELKLKERVRDVGGYRENPCLFELSLIFGCLKENNFNDRVCQEEVTKFQDCYRDSMRARETLQQRRLNPMKYIGSDKMIPNEINEMFRMFK